MPTARTLQIDTNPAAFAHSDSSSPYISHDAVSPTNLLAVQQQRLRTGSDASTASSMSIVSPMTSSTTASSLHLPQQPQQCNPYEHRSAPSTASSSSSRLDDSDAEYVLAMHDYAPQPGNDTCLSFKAGQVIHVLNRDTSGWWDGELDDGRRGWFPSNYVNAHMNSLTHEELPKLPSKTHRHRKSEASESWITRPSLDHMPQKMEADHCPPVMTPLFNGLSLLQTAVRNNRISHFQPATACIITCVRNILASTETLQRDAPILRRNPLLSEERRRILTLLAALVAQAKKASLENVDEDILELEVETMIRTAGQIFAHVRRFLAIAVQCGVEIPDGSQWNPQTILPSTRTPRRSCAASTARTPTPLRARSMVDLRQTVKRPTHMSVDMAAVMPHANKAWGQPLNRHTPQDSVSSSSSSSSTSSFKSTDAKPAEVPFPVGQTTTVQVLDAVRATHDQYLSTIAAFIGHAHSHSRASHASNTGHMYDLVHEIVAIVCKLLTIADAVMLHPDIPPNKVKNLSHSKNALYDSTTALMECVQTLTQPLAPTVTEEDEKSALLVTATSAVKVGADCVAAIKMCLSRSVGERPFVLQLPDKNRPPAAVPLQRPKLGKATSLGSLNTSTNVPEDHDDTIRPPVPPLPQQCSRDLSSGSEKSDASAQSSTSSRDTGFTSLDALKLVSPKEKPLPALLKLTKAAVEKDLPSPTSLAPTEAASTWEGAPSHYLHSLGKSSTTSSNAALSLQSIPQFLPSLPALVNAHDYSDDEVACNSEGHIVGATMSVLVARMTPHDNLVDAAFAAVFFMTFRLFSSPEELVDTLIARYNIQPPEFLSQADKELWMHQKGMPIRLRAANLVKSWVESYWRPGVDDAVSQTIYEFAETCVHKTFASVANRIVELLEVRQTTSNAVITPKGDRTRDPGMSINPPIVNSPSEIPRPIVSKPLFAALRNRNFSSISVLDFDALELARQLTLMECTLYCAIRPEEVLEPGQPGKPNMNVKAMSTLSTVITGWVTESILSEQDAKKRTTLVKFFVKVADRCVSLNNFSTSWSLLAALDSSTISRLHQTWTGLPQKNRQQLDALRKLSDRARNYREYRNKLRNTAPPAVPFLGLYLTDVTFCREGNPSTKPSPLDPNKQLINFNKYHKLARIVQDMQRFQVPYNFKAIPVIQEYLNVAFETSKKNSDLQDLYRRSLMIEPKRPVDTPPASASDTRLFHWASKSQTPSQTVAAPF